MILLRHMLIQFQTTLSVAATSIPSAKHHDLRHGTLHARHFPRQRCHADDRPVSLPRNQRQRCRASLEGTQGRRPACRKGKELDEAQKSSRGGHLATTNHTFGHSKVGNHRKQFQGPCHGLITIVS
ncbi:hypothetical protein IWZ00DRAFT_257278 [Phyllosticta capitalensis]